VRIGIFGGSFDPIHRGHLIVAAAAADQLRLDQVHFVVARAQPFKGGEHGASALQRAEMVGLAIAEDTRFVLDARELSREAPSYSVETLRELRHERPQDELFLLIGADVAQEFPQWRDAREVARLATVVVLTRPGIRPPAHEFVDRILVVPAVDISATAVRDKARHGESIRHLVPSHVGDYIETHRLYRPEGRER
jgi:nicotinate-nucleotide adenylyltransferase